MPKKSTELHTPQTLRRIVQRVAKASASLDAVALTMEEARIGEMDVQCHAEMVRALHKYELFVHEANRALHQTLEDMGWFTVQDGGGNNPGGSPVNKKTKPVKDSPKRSPGGRPRRAAG